MGKEGFPEIQLKIGPHQIKSAQQVELETLINFLSQLTGPCNIVTLLMWWVCALP